MNALSELLAQVLVGGFVILIMSYGFGLVLGGPNMANKVLGWELKKLRSLGLWVLRNILQIIADLFGAAARACGPPKKKKKKTA